MKDLKKRGFHFGTISIVLGVFIVTISIIWVTMAVLSGDRTSGDDVTWVG